MPPGRQVEDSSPVRGFVSGRATLRSEASPGVTQLGLVQSEAMYLNLQNGQNNGPYTVFTLYVGILGHSFGLFWRSRYYPERSGKESGKG